METVINDINSLIPYFLKFKNVWANFDEEADVLYLHFKKPNRADRTEMTDDNIIIRYEENEIIGISVLNASKRIKV